jgi:hypothetical protein
VKSGSRGKPPRRQQFCGTLVLCLPPLIKRNITSVALFYCCHRNVSPVSFLLVDGVRLTEFVGWLVYSCCSHLEHRASVKRFVPLQFLNLRHSVGLLGWGISPSQGRYLHTDIMSQVGFEPKISVFERAKTVYALDSATKCFFFKLVGWDFGYCGHYCPIVPAPDDR